MNKPTPEQRRAREQLFTRLGQHRHRRGPATGPARRRAVEEMLKDRDWARWSDDRIAQHVGVDPRTVGTVRRTLEVVGEIAFTRNVVGSDGTLFSRGQDPRARQARRARRLSQTGARAR